MLRRRATALSVSALVLAAWSVLLGPPAGAVVPGGAGLIAFDAGDGIEVMEPDGSNRKQISETGGAPSWSPDGTRIAFFDYVPATDEYAIFVMNADGTGITQITHPNDIGIDSVPDWSPDGSRIAFVRRISEEGRDHIFLVDPDGTRLTQLTDCTQCLGPGEFEPAWSPDGTQIAFASSDAGNPDLYSIRMDGTGWKVQRLTVTPGIDDNEARPSWSPDGTQIAYEKTNFAGTAGDIWVMKADGKGQRELTHVFSSDDHSPAWSPDGTRIAYSCGFRVCVINHDGTQKATLTEDVSGSPDWQAIPCTVSGTSGDDALIGTAGDDIICGLDGDDSMLGLEGNDILLGGVGDDRIDGGSGNDLLVGQAGSDRLRGGSGVDTLDAVDFIEVNDRADGGPDDDTCRWDQGDIVLNCP